MGLTPGTRLDSCEILDMLGSGGMGEVYRGRDTKLGREVAVKALPAASASDAEGLARIEREAQVLAALNHPNIAVIHELKEVNGGRYLILELVEGETLAERIARGPVRLEDALKIALQIAAALEAAHLRGIIHRDLKPANVKITPDGQVKVLDFGLAKIQASLGAAPSLSNSPTLTAMDPTSGVILGTAAYMSPEQARGEPVDRRADVWAFGCVLYEMLTGRQAFPQGETFSDTLAGILAREPDWSALPEGTPLKIRALLERCLRKDARRRWSGIGNVRTEIEDAASEQEAEAVSEATPARERGRQRLLQALAALFLLVTVGTVLWMLLRPAPEEFTLRSELVAAADLNNLTQAEISPDGTKIAFLATQDDERRIWVRPVDGEARPLSGTEGTGPEFFWSADSRSIAFSAEGRLKKVLASGGPSQSVGSLPAGDEFSGDWNAENVILIGGRGGPLYRLPGGGTGGEPVPETELDAMRSETSHAYPSFLPDGRHYLFLARSSDPAIGLAAFVGELGSSERDALPGIASEVKYSSTGHLIFIRDGALMAQGFDPNRLEFTGDAFPIADPFVLRPTDVEGPFSASDTGSLSYSRPFTLTDIETAVPNVQLTWFDREGTPLGSAGPAGPYAEQMIREVFQSFVESIAEGKLDIRLDGGPQLSPDGTRVAFYRGTPPDIHVLDIEDEISSPLTTDPAADSFPIWSPDSRRIVFRSERDGAGNLWIRELDAVTPETLLFSDEYSKTPTHWWGDTVVYHTSEGEIWTLDVSDPENPTPRQVTDTPFRESDGWISPDGQWLAYVSNEAGAAEVYVQSFPEGNFKQKVSEGGGILPRWDPATNELIYYVFPAFTLMTVSITPTDSDPEITAPELLFTAANTVSYNVGRDGGFLGAVLLDTGGSDVAAVPIPAHIVLLQNWAADLEE